MPEDERGEFPARAYEWLGRNDPEYAPVEDGGLVPRGVVEADEQYRKRLEAEPLGQVAKRVRRRYYDKLFPAISKFLPPGSAPPPVRVVKDTGVGAGAYVDDDVITLGEEVARDFAAPGKRGKLRRQNQRNTLIHETAHVFQRRPRTKAEVEGGATAFATAVQRRIAPRTVPALTQRKRKRVAAATDYGQWAQNMWRKHGKPWVWRGQFQPDRGGRGLRQVVRPASAVDIGKAKSLVRQNAPAGGWPSKQGPIDYLAARGVSVEIARKAVEDLYREQRRRAVL